MIDGKKKTANSMLETLRESNYEFFLTGSRAVYDQPATTGDWDLFAVWSLELERFLVAGGFKRLTNDTIYDNMDRSVIAVFRYTNPGSYDVSEQIDVQLIWFDHLEAKKQVNELWKRQGGEMRQKLGKGGIKFWWKSVMEVVADQIKTTIP